MSGAWARSTVLGGALLALVAAALSLPFADEAQRAQPTRGARVARGVTPSALPTHSPDTNSTTANVERAAGTHEAAGGGPPPVAAPAGDPEPPPPPAHAEPSPAEVAALERASAASDPAQLLDLARRTPHPLLRIEAVARYVEQGAELSALLPWSFEHAHTPLHAFVGRTLADGAPPELTSALRPWLDDPRSSVRLAAADALLGLRARGATAWTADAQRTLRTLAADPAFSVEAVDCLARHDPAAALQTLLELVADPGLPPAARLDAAYGVAELAPERSRRVFAELARALPNNAQIQRIAAKLAR